MKKIILLSVLLVSLGMLSAVFNDYQPSARARAMSNAYVAISDDANGVFFNPAGIYSAQMSASVGMAQLFGEDFSELKTGSFVYPLPKKLGTIGLGIKGYDVDYEDEVLMSEYQYTLAHGFNLMEDIHSAIRIGWSANFYHLSMDGFDEDNAFGLNLGALATLHQRTNFGFAVCNLNQPKMGENNQHSLPRKFSMGISYIPYDQVITSIEMKKDFAQDTEFMGGVEVRLFDPFYIRAGVHQNPATWSAGAGFRLIGIVLDYSFTMHSVLSPTHYFNISYNFAGK
ncbi:MAG TPA: hypothetical protein PLF50_06555 [Candidatus Cloacimonadota bacterium]|nr:hypothetical protein [Candidatus Cloacimonadota bacterium]HOV17132.1 hypothetical protein [Candidatus Cloacimonadota bacterium]HQL15414.1 hypothetical protein [Candidatus Cloacimonadota bacterium]